MRGSVGGTVGRSGMLMLGRVIVGMDSDVGGVDVGVDVVGTLLLGDGGDPICWAPGMRL